MVHRSSFQDQHLVGHSLNSAYCLSIVATFESATIWDRNVKFLLELEHYCLDSMASYQFGHTKETFERLATANFKRNYFHIPHRNGKQARKLTSADIFPVGDMSIKFPIFIPDCCCEAGEKFMFGLDGGNREG